MRGNIIHRIGIIAGGGEFPLELAKKLEKENKSFFIIGLKGFVNISYITNFPHVIISMGEVKKIVDILHKEHCSDIVFIGPVRRPKLRDLKLDSLGIKWLGRLGMSIWRSDNTLFSSIIGFLEEEGFFIRGAHEFLENTSNKTVCLTKTKPDSYAMKDIKKAQYALDVVSVLDFGQACVVQDTLILAIEGLEGTDEMLKRCKDIQYGKRGAVLVKKPKLGQTLKIDMPAIGPHTIYLASQFGFSGIAYEVNKVLILDLKKCLEIANNSGLFIYGFESEK